MEKEARNLRESVRRLERTLGIMEEDGFSCCGVGFAQCHALVEIGRAGSVSLNELSSLLNVDTSSMCRTVERLVKSRLVKREADPEDRRCVRILLTAKGTELFGEIESRMEAYFTQVMSGIPEEKQMQVLESMELLLGALAKTGCCGSPGMKDKK